METKFQIIFAALHQLNLIPIFFSVNKFVLIEKRVKAYAAVIEKKTGYVVMITSHSYSGLDL